MSHHLGEKAAGQEGTEEQENNCTQKRSSALAASPRLQPEKSLLPLMGLKEVFRSTETKDASSSTRLCFSPSFSVCGTTSSEGGRGQAIRLTVRADHC